MSLLFDMLLSLPAFVPAVPVTSILTNQYRNVYTFFGACTRKAQKNAGRKALHFYISFRQSTRFCPQKNRATVPGPVWLPMVVPT
jgi:hypothetical protein